MLLATCLSIGAQAQVAAGATAPATVSSGSNLLAVLLVITSLALAFVIWGMGQVLLTLSKQMLQKQNSGTATIATALILLVCLPGISFAMAAACRLLIPDWQKKMILSCPSNSFNLFFNSPKGIFACSKSSSARGFTQLWRLICQHFLYVGKRYRSGDCCHFFSNFFY